MNYKMMALLMSLGATLNAAPEDVVPAAAEPAVTMDAAGAVALPPDFAAMVPADLSMELAAAPTNVVYAATNGKVDKKTAKIAKVKKPRAERQFNDQLLKRVRQISVTTFSTFGSVALLIVGVLFAQEKINDFLNLRRRAAAERAPAAWGAPVAAGARVVSPPVDVACVASSRPPSPLAAVAAPALEGALVSSGPWGGAPGASGALGGALPSYGYGY